MRISIIAFLLIVSNYQAGLTQSLPANGVQINKARYGLNSYIRWEREPLISGDQVLLLNDYLKSQIKAIPKIACFDLEKKKILWEKEFRQGITDAAANGSLFFIAAGNLALAIDKMNGKVVWERAFEPPKPDEEFYISIALVRGTKDVMVVVPQEQAIKILDSASGKTLRSNSTILRHYPPAQGISCRLLSIKENEFAITTGKKLLQVKNDVVAWEKTFKSSYFTFLGFGDLDNDSQQDILVASRTQIAVFSSEGRQQLQFEGEDNFRTLQIVELKNRRFLLANFTRGALDLIDNRGKLKWEFYNPADTEQPSMFMRMLVKALGKAGYPFAGKVIEYESNQSKNVEIIALAGGRIYVLNAEGQLVKQLDLLPHDKHFFNMFAEAKYPMFFYKNKLIVVTSAFDGKVIEKDQPGDFQVTDFIFYLDIKNTDISWKNSKPLK